MSQIAQLLIEAGRNAAAAREQAGQIWGQTAERLAQIPGQVQNQFAQQQQLQLQKEREARLNTAQDLENQQRSAGIAAGAKTAQDETITGRILGSGLVKDDGTADADAMEKLARDAGRPDLVPHIRDQVTKWNAGTADLKLKQSEIAKATLGLKQMQQDQLGVDAQRLIRDDGTVDPDILKTFITTRIANGTLDKDQAEADAQRVHADPSQALPLVTGWINGSKTAAEIRKSNRITTSEGQTVTEVTPGKPPTVIAQGGPKPKPLDQQLLEAVSTGDTDKVAKIKQTLLTDAQAKRDPAQAAMALQLSGLRADEARARLEERDTGSEKNQQKFEQQYRTVLQRGLSSRSGGLGLEDAKVQQANHLMAIFEQNYDPKTGDYNIPRVQLNELALGLARLTSPGGQAGEGMLKEFQQRTAKGDIAGALTYLTGQPIAANTQAITKMLKDSIERQGKTAETNREGEMSYLRGLAPTDLAEPRRQALEATSLNALRQSRVIQNTQTGERKLQVSTDGGETWK